MRIVSGSKLASVVVVHVEQFDGAFPGCRQTDNSIVSLNKMVVPVLLPRMEEWDKFVVHKSCQIRPFVKIAPVARET